MAGQIEQVEGLLWPVDQVGAEMAHRLDHNGHTAGLPVIGQVVKALGDALVFFRQGRAAAHHTGVTVERTGIGQRAQLRGQVHLFFVPGQPGLSFGGVFRG
jgi:hypothetical protein